MLETCCTSSWAAQLCVQPSHLVTLSGDLPALSDTFQHLGSVTAMSFSTGKAAAIGYVLNQYQQV